MMIKEIDNHPSKEFRTCHFASLAEVINPRQHVSRQSKSRKAIIHRLLVVAFQAREAIARREAGEPLTDIGRSYGVSHSTISRL
jgi:hypothetical protein